MKSAASIRSLQTQRLAQLKYAVRALWLPILEEELGTLIFISYSSRSPKDKRVVKDNVTASEIWWGPVNIPISPASHNLIEQMAINYLNTRERVGSPFILIHSSTSLTGTSDGT